MAKNPPQHLRLGFCCPNYLTSDLGMALAQKTFYMGPLEVPHLRRLGVLHGY